MRKISLITLILCCINYIYCQDYIILKSDSTKLVGKVSKVGQQIGITIYDNKTKYELSQLIEYSKGDDIYQVFESEGYNKAFPLKERGAVNLYIRVKGMPPNYTYLYYVKKEGQSYPQRVGAAQTTLHNKKFREEYSLYFENCEKVKKMILNKVVKPIDIQYIVQTYNDCIE